jgi:phosphate transport system substrate-binding protein
MYEVLINDLPMAEVAVKIPSFPHLEVIPGLREYVQFFVSDDMAGPDGALAQYGLVPDPELAATQEEWANK